MAERIVSRASLLEVRLDRAVITEGHRFLDEKRVMLAREMLSRLEDYQTEMRAWTRAAEWAERALQSGVVRHGLEGLQVYPARHGGLTPVQRTELPFLGISLITGVRGLETMPDATAEREAVNPSPEAETCAAAFAVLLPQAMRLAAARANLLRLRDEFLRTDRRVRAIENVILPEIAQEERRISDLLDENDQEEVIRTHLFAGTRTKPPAA